ncbi:MAG TPA: Crp/Fnr family transcriptional regulator [Bacteroidota bacterium]|nr:Crp/Fnr family transcriptional regulator [Bacteroidota bacterium]
MHSPPFLEALSEKERQAFQQYALRVPVHTGMEISHEGDDCRHFPLMESGVIRVYKLSREGQELTLYRIRSGESCILTMTCLLRTSPFPANAVVEQEGVVWLVPAEVFREWTTRYTYWTEYVVTIMTRTIGKLVGLVDDMMFRRVDLRIVDYLLLNTPAGSDELRITHQRLAFDVGTAREVVSRHLKDLETRGLVALSRASIRITNRQGLQRLAEIL